MNQTTIKESACRFGAGRRLVGVLTLPPGPAPRRAFVLVTAGMTPKFGPFRLYTQVARRLAGEGWIVLRFDLGGVGDSGPGPSGLPLAERTRLEIAAAVDHLHERFALDGTALAGLCSGAEDALRYAEGDPRVTRLVLMDPFGYPTAGWRMRDLPIRLARTSLWLLGLVPTYGLGSAALVDYRHMTLEESSRLLLTVIGRGVSLHFVYTGGMRETFNHEGQFRAMFRAVDFRGLAALDYFPRLRHTQELEADRRDVIDAIARRARSGP